MSDSEENWKVCYNDMYKWFACWPSYKSGCAHEMLVRLLMIFVLQTVNVLLSEKFMTIRNSFNVTYFDQYSHMGHFSTWLVTFATQVCGWGPLCDTSAVYFMFLYVVFCLVFIATCPCGLIDSLSEMGPKAQFGCHDWTNYCNFS